MRARLATQRARYPPAALSSDDPAIALLDCWAIVGDIVPFYCERFANEGYLGTAADAESLRWLGQLVEFRARPALGASGHLAFTMDPGAVGVIPAGSQALSVAGPGELPQPFETVATIEARAEWNELEVRMARPLQLDFERAMLLDRFAFAGTALNLRAGDRVLFAFRGD